MSRLADEPRDELRLLAGEASDFEKELLGSWGAEQPGDAARENVLAMVGLTAIAAATGAGTAASLAPKAAAVGASALAKWLVVGALGAIGASAGAAALVYTGHQRQALHDAHAHAHEQVAVAPPPHDVAATAAPQAPPAPPSLATTVLAPPAHAPTTPRPRVTTETTRQAPTDDALGEQVAALDRARHALANGDPASTLRLLDDYEARFPRGALVEEADVLRVESLLAANDPSGATRAGARFLAAHPGSPHAARVRALLGQAPTP